MELDHVFVCVDRGAFAAQRLSEWGLQEGAPNVHAGQGTANRRFFFGNAFLELLWVEDDEAARSPETAPTRLWERWSGRESGSCPFGIVLRPGVDGNEGVPFDGWGYRPKWLPDGLSIWIGETGIEEPMLVYMPFAKSADWAWRVVPHPAGVSGISGVRIGCPDGYTSAGFRCLPAGVCLSAAEEYSLTVEFDGGLAGEILDLRPDVPLILKR